LGYPSHSGDCSKGQPGQGLQIVAVPVIAAFFDVRLAVAALALPNLCTNLLQVWTCRFFRKDPAWTIKFVLSGAFGATIGTFALKIASDKTLMTVLTVTVVLYIALRLTRPEAGLATTRVRSLVVPLGILGGILQGAAGVSAPVSVSFLNALNFPREQFVLRSHVFRPTTDPVLNRVADT